MGARRKGRELALQALYQLELSGEESAGALHLFFQRCEAGGRAKAFAAALVEGVCAQQERIDRLIAQASEHWRVGRLSRVDLNILRIATYELTAGGVPTSVILDEAIEIARRFSTAASAVFVNGILDQIAARLGVKEAPAAGDVREDG
ncbi:MAG: transcription antitermination factor NusB [Candidatus Binatia bacterium]